MILRFFRFIFKQFGYKIISIKDYENGQKMNRILTNKYQDDIKTLVFEPNSEKAKEIRMLKTMERHNEFMMWFGTTTIPTNHNKGIVNPPETA